MIPFLIAAALTLAPQDARLLAPGAAVEREVGGTETHEFDVRLEAGQQATLTLTQQGIDVIVRLVDPALAFDDDMRPDGREQVTLVADSSRLYRLVVVPRYPKVPRGRYALWIESVRAATDRDRDAFEARKLAAEAAALRSAGKFDDALPKLTRVVSLAETAIGEGAFFAGQLSSLAGTQRSKGQFEAAEGSFRRAIDVATRALGDDHPLTGALKETLGVMYNAIDDPGRAEPLMVGGTAIIERALGDHPRLAVALMDLALFHSNRGDDQRALAELQRALQVSDKTMSPDEFSAIAIVNNLGDLYVSMKDYDRAQPLVERAVRDLERTLGRDSFRIATPLLNLSIIARERGDYPAALAHLRRAYTLRETTYGAEHTETASLLITIGNVYHAQKEYGQALDAYQRAHDVLERTAGAYHSLTLLAINNAARTLAATGDVDAAIARRAMFETRLDRAISFNLATGSEREKLAYLEQTFERMGRTISLHLQQAPGSVAAAELAATTILRRKGRVLDASLDSRAILRTHAGPADTKLLDELATVMAELSTLSLRGPGRTPAAAYRQNVEALDRRREALEGAISRSSASFRAESQDVSLDAIRAALPPGGALIEFAVYQPFDATAATDAAAHAPPRYAAYVIRADAPPRGVDVGAVTTIDAQVARFRDALRDPKRTDVEALARTLDAAVLRPVRNLTGSATRLLIAPDGALNLIPFEALVDARGRFAVERYAISYLAGGRDLLRMQIPRTAGGAPLVIADPAFGVPGARSANPPIPGDARPGLQGARSEDPPKPGQSRPDPRVFAPLAGTAREAAAIARVLRGAQVLTGAAATKAALTRAASPAILHVASHAYFDRDGAQTDPLLRAGIALAGANSGERNDGILTGLEASTLNLSGTQLVTLSACDTGVGEVRSGEGVYGLRRAFSLAGAESLLMSLWPVSDYVTRTMMTEVYDGLSRGLGREAALRRVQRAMLADPRRRHPYYWAAFIQAGDWRPLGPRR